MKGGADVLERTPARSIAAGLPPPGLTRTRRTMLYDQLSKDLYAEICHIPIIDPHTHIDPRQPTARSLDDILGYHYYTELAHSAGMEKFPAGSDVHSRDRARSIVYHMSHFDNTAQYQ